MTSTSPLTAADLHDGATIELEGARVRLSDVGGRRFRGKTFPVGTFGVHRWIEGRGDFTKTPSYYTTAAKALAGR